MDEPDRQARWPRRRVAGLGLRALMIVVPFALGVATTVVLSRRVPGAESSMAWLRQVGILAVSWLVLAVAHRALHRLLPLAVLLEMSLVFPERAPSRLALARRVASRRDLDDLLAGRTPDAHETTQQAAERILALVGALAEHDRGTRGHSERVRVLSDLIADRLRLPEADRDRLRWAALLHDIGKLQVPVTILNKPARPSAAEWDVLRRHPDHGDELIAPLRAWLGPWADTVVQHHERWDGAGYPRGLAGEEICLGARIVTVADAFDVMTAVRAYKKASGRVAALRELVRCSGSQFDPTVVRALITVPQQRLLLGLGPASWLTALPFVGQGQGMAATVLANQAGVAAGTLALSGTAVVAPISAIAVGGAPASSSVSSISSVAMAGPRTSSSVAAVRSTISRAGVVTVGGPAAAGSIGAVPVPAAGPAPEAVPVPLAPAPAGAPGVTGTTDAGAASGAVAPGGTSSAAGTTSAGGSSSGTSSGTSSQTTPDTTTGTTTGSTTTGATDGSTSTTSASGRSGPTNRTGGTRTRRSGSSGSGGTDTGWGSKPGSSKSGPSRSDTSSGGSRSVGSWTGKSGKSGSGSGSGRTSPSRSGRWSATAGPSTGPSAEPGGSGPAG